jgi:uncharacterized protein
MKIFFKKKLREHFREVIEVKTTPHGIALGFAIGTVIAVLPTFGLGALVGLLIVLIFKRISKISLFLAFAFWNPLILIPLTGLSYFIGNFLLQGEPVIKFKIEIINYAFIYTRRFLVGNLIVSTTAAILSYFIVLFLVKKYKKKQIPILQKPLEL